MSTLAGMAALVGDGGFVRRCTAAAVKTALAVLGEDPGELTPAQTGKRQAFAARVLENPDGVWAPVAWAVAANPTVAAAGRTASDGDIEYVLTQVWDDLSGVTAQDRVPPPSGG